MTIPLANLINAGTVHWTGDLPHQVDAIVAQASNNLIDFNQTTTETKRRAILGQLFGAPLDQATVLNPPFQTDFGAHTFIGKHVFINRDCFFVDLGGVYIEDNALIGPRVMLISVGHHEDPAYRRDLVLKSVRIKQGAWLGANVTVLPGVTVGEHAIVGAGAVVTKNVPANTVVAGVPAKVLRTIQQ
ncbi:sugar O-acetyltransferase [Loigolactobacillus bifermentans]|uniref:Acetyltransferase n=1 Tax=Loigolactobacillus bifermentans DSM 20003 TaxID=1423726 RepID=A0A0R1H950_9LACO|nr:sugar O-acetyltransferase [Loigolactobacillus bifermentans]KRK39495.1 acetyltransferase [Loigolactobacillus bifermentans DSM 20003]QGG61260.1 sugar O-acetyltransferase [Loigolactobacillus bifermentans]